MRRRPVVLASTAPARAHELRLPLVAAVAAVTAAQQARTAEQAAP